MAVDESEEGRKQFPLVLGVGGAHLRGDDFGLSALEVDRAAVVPVLPARPILALAAHPDVGPASTLANGRLFRHQHPVEARTRARNDLDDFHGKPRESLGERSISRRRRADYPLGRPQAGAKTLGVIAQATVRRTCTRTRRAPCGCEASPPRRWSRSLRRTPRSRETG